MNLPFYIARRYLFSPKKVGVINIISGISMCGVALATLALVCTLSVFNGFQEMVAGFFTTFDPELKITTTHGKVFSPTHPALAQIRQWPDIKIWAETLEENALVQYKERQLVATIKGVDENFRQLTTIDSLLHGGGTFILRDSIVDYAVMGVGLMAELGSGIQFVDALRIYAPRRNEKINLLNPTSAFNRHYLHSPGVVFMVNQQKYDDHYLLTSIEFARKLFDYTDEVSAIELKLTQESSIDKVQKKIQAALGNEFKVENQYEQQADVFRVMEIEKLISYLFLTFILTVACFNVIGTLTMLILDKSEDVETLRRLGANDRLICRIFLFEGRLISFIGAFIGIIVGIILCLLQQTFGFITLGESGQFVVDAYPVSVHISDILLIFITVVIVGSLAVWYPVRYLSKRLLTHNHL